MGAERTAIACGDRQVTYRELEERANRLAHHLAGLGVGPGDHVGLYARNSTEAVETLLAACKLRAAAVNINYGYVENELQYMLADSDPTALVYDRRLAPVVRAVVAQSAPGLRGLVEVDDGSPPGALPDNTAAYADALAGAPPGRDFAARSADDVYVIYTGGTTGYPKGVMWRHEDIWRTLAGGIDFVTGVPLTDEWEQSRTGLDRGEFVKLCAAPLIHGNAQVAALAGLFTGETIVMLPAFDPVLAAGGIGCGRQVAAALALGAAGVWMGSAWLVTQEYQQLSTAPALQQALLAAASSDTVRSRIYSGKPARLLKNRWTDAWEEPGAPEPLRMPLQNLLVSEAHQRLMRSGQPDVVPMPAGQIIGRMTEVRPVADVMADLVRETNEVLDRLHDLR